MPHHWKAYGHRIINNEDWVTDRVICTLNPHNADYEYNRKIITETNTMITHLKKAAHGELTPREAQELLNKLGVDYYA